MVTVFQFIQFCCVKPAVPRTTDIEQLDSKQFDKTRGGGDDRIIIDNSLADNGAENLVLSERLVEAGLGDQEAATISGHKSMQM